MFGLRILHEAVKGGERVLETIEHIRPVVEEALEGLAQLEDEVERIRAQLDQQ